MPAIPVPIATNHSLTTRHQSPRSGRAVREVWSPSPIEGAIVTRRRTDCADSRKGNPRNWRFVLAKDRITSHAMLYG
ncbi:hypothetical protein RB6870 [Rhodopirellula baltica SH 1]|uniref:Uncharacterized protein n=1 Tax=Rhodopirellula baltica (strain DSM 10527 / NCIMB 13988 / SH1) TaxID=243090 RepID=Q7UPK8_RHOBA|nr:hypothetical protein RB6870 [Rhodopirellula baltica SH 1]